jgi:hypothetical protein
LLRTGGCEATFGKASLGPAVCEANLEVGTPGYAFAERVLIDADSDAFFERFGVEEAFERAVETWLVGHARETSVVAADGFVAVDRVPETVDTAEFVYGCIFCRTFGGVAGHLVDVDKGGVVKRFFFETCRACVAITDPAITTVFYPYDTKAAFAVTPESRAVFHAIRHAGGVEGWF